MLIQSLTANSQECKGNRQVLHIYLHCTMLKGFTHFRHERAIELTQTSRAVHVIGIACQRKEDHFSNWVVFVPVGACKYKYLCLLTSKDYASATVQTQKFVLDFLTRAIHVYRAKSTLKICIPQTNHGS